MSIRICPECAKAFFMPLLEDYAKCPHCGVFLADRRSLKREKKELLMTLSVKGSTCRARTTDFSRRGAGIRFAGLNLEMGMLIDVSIDEPRIRRPARTVWTRLGTGQTIAAGIELL